MKIWSTHHQDTEKHKYPTDQAYVTYCLNRHFFPQVEDDHVQVYKCKFVFRWTTPCDPELYSSINELPSFTWLY